MEGAAGAIAALIIASIVMGVVVYSILQGDLFVLRPAAAYSNNVVTIQDLTITDAEPLEGSETTIAFLVRNNGDKTIKQVDVSFIDAPFFDKGKMRIQCGFESSLSSGSKCSLTDLEPFDAQIVQAVLPALKLPVESDQKTSIKFKVSYSFQASREANIPIVEDRELVPPSSRYTISTAPISPIQVNIDPPVGLTRIEGDRKIVENFARKGKPFKVKFSFFDATGISKDAAEPVVFPPVSDKLSLELVDFRIEVCDKLNSNGKPLIDLEVPFTIECSFVSTVTEQIPTFVLGKIIVNYNFDYSFTRSLSVTIKKLPKTQDTTPSSGGTQESEGTNGGLTISEGTA